MTVPGWWQFVLLALASFRCYRLLAEDAVLDRPRRWLIGLGDWREGQPPPAGYRPRLGEFLNCAYCLGFWLSLAWWGGWVWQPHWALVAATPLAISGLVGIIAGLLPE